MEYFVVMIDYGRRGREAIVDPEITYSGVVSRVRSGEYTNICFIHHVVVGQSPDDVTRAVLEDAGANADLVLA